MDNLTKLISIEEDKVNNMLGQLEQYDAVFTGISKELTLTPSGTQVIAFLEAVGVDKCYIDQARLHIVSEGSYKNVDAFYDAFRLNPDNKLFNINIVSEPIKFLASINTVIKRVIDALFDSLNKSTDDNRFHKAICLRRDIKRMEAVACFGAMPKTFKGIDWNKIEICEDYIDGSVELGFLDRQNDYLLKYDAPETFWGKSDLCYCLTSDIRYRIEFLKRLAAFGIDIPDAVE